MAESKFDKIFENALDPPADPPPVQPEKRPARVVDLGHHIGGGKPTGQLPATETLQPIARRPLGRPPGKRSDPAWKQFSVLLKRETQREAARLLREKDDGLDFSGLVQTLVEHWIKRQK
jgi:hypothetical protein